LTRIPHLTPRQGFWLALTLSFCLLAGVPAEASARKARRLWEQGRQAELAKDYDTALELFELALVEDPKDPRYQLTVHRMRFVAGQAYLHRGRQLREEGHLEEAAASFQRALEIDPASAVASQERQQTMELIEERRKLAPGASLPPVSPLERVREERDRRLASMQGPPELQPISTDPINLTIPNQDSKVVFETIGKLAGINAIFDPEYRDKRISIDLQNATLYEALDYASLLAKAFWKPLSHNAIFITNEDTNKRRDYDEEVVKTFYLTNVATPQELQEIATAVRGLTEIRRVFAVNSMNALIVRGPADKIALTEKIIADIDKARPEVIIDVLVLETSKTAAHELGMTVVSGSANGINVPITFTGEGAGAGDAGVPLAELGRVGSNDWSTVLPGGVVTALMSRSDTRLLQSPRVRAADNFAATLNIGSRVPVATGSFQPGIGGVGVNPLVNTQFNYIDVGVNVTMTPKIHNNREVSIHIEVDVSNVSGEVGKRKYARANTSPPLAS
jgi:general secretion pathway protein D